jgi:hypothetical protein
MDRVRRYHDNIAANFTLKGAILYEVFYCFFCWFGTFIVLDHHQSSDREMLYLGLASLLIGIFGIFHGAQVIHAVVRRLISENRNPSSPSFIR